MQTSVGRSRPVLQLTLALVKPDAVAHPLILQAIHQKILDNNFIILMHKYLKWDQEESRTFYAEHSGRFFYQRVVEFMTSGPMRAYILAREDAIQRWRHLMGPTKVFRARYSAPKSIRGNYGLTDTRNTTHGSGEYSWTRAPSVKRKDCFILTCTCLWCTRSISSRCLLVIKFII
ncbi:nucleoside diphosphate kinase 6 [Rhincodon typus]|uniref:nucleoside diphosphate kinase 6 n=1 Tax=Rhincodon typus TaxID=259920 RepID=UPI00202E944D|nr:nucleoside diphosphate kinase 6 [Rhincodon typus]